MSKTARILVPLDGSPMAEQAIAYAAAIAGNDGQITFLHVVPQPEPLRGLFGGQIASVDEVLHMARETGAALMTETIERWRPVLGIDPGIIIEAGDPADVTLDVIESTGATLLALASHGRGMAGRIAFGSVADRLARTSPVPVLIVHPQVDQDGEPHPARIHRLVITLDGSDIAREALPIAGEVARETGASVHLVSAVNPSAVLMPSPVGSAYYPEDLYQEIADDMNAAARESLTEAAEMLEGLTVTKSIVEGPAAAAIESVLQAGDLVVMTSHGRSGFKRWLLGSVSEKLIRSGVAPVLLVPSSARIASKA